MFAIVSKVISIFLIMAVGFGLYKKDIFTAKSTKYFVDLLLLVTTPCMILSSITSKEFDTSMALSMLQVFGLACGFFAVASFAGWFIFTKVVKDIPKEDLGVYIFSFASVNNGFMGFPITQAIFGGDIFYFMILHNIVLSFYLYGPGPLILSINHPGAKLNFKTLLKKVVNPSIVASVIGIVMLVSGLHLPAMLFDTVSTIGDITVPLSMLVVGMQLGDTDIRNTFKNKILVVMAMLKMVLMPFIVFLLVNWLPIAATVKVCIIFGSVFPSAVVTSAVTLIENKNATLAAECIAVSTLMSVVTIPVIAMLLCGYYGM